MKEPLDTELQPVSLVQAEAIDVLANLRLLTFESDVRFEALDAVLTSLENNKQIGTVRSFYDRLAGPAVMFLVTMDYASAERLLLEQDQLGLYVEYQVISAYADTESRTTAAVTRFAVTRADLVQMPQRTVQPNAIFLPLRPAKTWRWDR